MVEDSGSSGAGSPSLTGGFYRPNPVRYITRMSPRCTGLVEVTTRPLAQRMMVGKLASSPAEPLRNTRGSETARSTGMYCSLRRRVHDQRDVAAREGRHLRVDLGRKRTSCWIGWPFTVRQLSLMMVGRGTSLVA